MRKRAAYVLELISQREDAAEARKAYVHAKAHLDDIKAADDMRRRNDARHERAELKALEAFKRRQAAGPVRELDMFLTQLTVHHAPRTQCLSPPSWPEQSARP